MKHILVCLAFFAFLSCKQKSTEISNKVENSQIEVKSKFPEPLSMVFKAHGGIKQWKSMKSLEFTMNKPDGDEVTSVNLKNRKSLISMPKHSLGYDGSLVWLLNKDTLTYKGKAKFYYNLMFYFNAMPFVFSDEGIRYTESEPLLFEGKTYPGIKISYDKGVGESSEDEYVLYYDEVTHRMAWLAYTVTYFSKEKSKKFNFIKYDKWQEIGGLLVPKVLQWYQVENNLPTMVRNNVEFTNVKLSTKAFSNEIFEKPEKAIVVN